MAGQIAVVKKFGVAHKATDKSVKEIFPIWRELEQIDYKTKFKTRILSTYPRYVNINVCCLNFVQ